MHFLAAVSDILSLCFGTKIAMRNFLFIWFFHFHIDTKITNINTYFFDFLCDFC